MAIVQNKLITLKDGFNWYKLNEVQAYKCWNESVFEIYAVFDDETESLLESLEEIKEAFEQNTAVCMAVGQAKPKPWFHQAKKTLISGHWYVKVSDIN